ncbi:MAG: hypothetical protein ABII26_08950 [Pseudomonadota bacterium]
MGKLSLGSWVITEENIKDVDREEEGPSLRDVDPETVKKIEENLKDLFKKTDLDDPLTSAIYRFAKKLKIKELEYGE